jgi:nicotinate phosphoribosyltransferase
MRLDDGLKTDLYQIAMIAASYFIKNKHNNRAVCEAFARKLPPCRRFLVMVGTNCIKEYLLNVGFEKSDISFLREKTDLKGVFATTNFDKYLEDFRFKGDLWAMAEGEIVFAGEPLIKIVGTLPEIHIAETFALSVLNHDIHIASKAVRIVLAARGRTLLEFGTRRTHHEAAIDAARAAYLVGFSATSNLRASERFGIPNAGTMSHMWIMLSDDEQQAFEDFSKVYKSPTLLVDTYDTLNGVELASKIKGLAGIRLDSGDFDTLSREARKILDDNNCKSTKIAVSGDMNEYKIDSLLQAKSPIDVFGVGTELVSPKDINSLGIVYKAVYDITRDKPVIKLSKNKVTYPGSKQVYLDIRNGGWSHLVALDGFIKSSEELMPLLDLHMMNGKVIDESNVSLDVSRKYCNAALLNLHSNLASLEDRSDGVAGSAPVFPDKSLIDLFKKATEEYEFNMGIRRNIIV